MGSVFSATPEAPAGAGAGAGAFPLFGEYVCPQDSPATFCPLPEPGYMIKCTRISGKKFKIEIFLENGDSIASVEIDTNVNLNNSSSVCTDYVHTLPIINSTNEHRVKLYVSLEKTKFLDFVIVSLSKQKDNFSNAGNILWFGPKKYDSITLVKIDNPPVLATKFL